MWRPDAPIAPGRAYSLAEVQVPADVAVVTQDPWFGGGARRQTEAFCDAVRALGREPRLFYLARERALSPLRGTVAWRPKEDAGRASFPSFLPEADALNQVLGGERMADPVRRSASVWVVAAAAHYGHAAVRSRHRYACWIGTTLAAEWAGRTRGLPASRRIARTLNAPALKTIERRVLRGASRVYAVSPATREALDAMAVARREIGVIPIPVDADRFAPEPDESWEARLGTPVLTFAGRAGDPRKNVRLHVDAFRLIRRELPAARLRLVGPPPYGAFAAAHTAGIEVLERVPGLSAAK